MSTQTPYQAPVVQTTDGYDGPTTGVRKTYTETKLGFKTSEFFVMFVFVAGVLLATYADQDSLARNNGWFIAGLAVAAYIVSRGLAKLGTREPYDEDRNR